MTRFERFTFLCSKEERQAIVKLATHLQRSQSDAIRYVVTEAVQELERRGLIQIRPEQPNLENSPTNNDSLIAGK